MLTNAPTAKNLVVWDGLYFDSVRQAGYVFTESRTNIPFFPLFPYLWRWLGVDGLGISGINFGFLLLGTGILGHTFGMRRYQVLLLLSVPTVFFCLVPYAEALFFFFGAILLRGMHRQQLGLTVVGLIGCCLARSAATLFVPAFVFAEALACVTRAELPRLALRIGAGLLAIAAALGLVLYLHYQATGDAWIFFTAHEKWAHVPHWWPLPSRLHSAVGITVLWLDLLAVFTGLLALVICLNLGIRWLVCWFWPGANGHSPAPSRAILFALAYCSAAIGFIFIYQNGDLVGSSRYVLATPFFGVLLLELFRWRTLPSRTRWAMGGLAIAIALGLMIWLGWPARFPGFFPAEAHVFFALWVAYVLLYPLAALERWRYAREVRAGLYVANVVYQAFLLNTFISQVWMG